MKKYKKLTLILAALTASILLIALSFLIYYWPSIKLEEEKTTLNVFSNYDYSNFAAYQNFKAINDKVQITSNVNTQELGVYKTEYKVKYGIFESKKIQVVKVVDNEPPVINLAGDSKITVCSLDKYEEPGYEAIDNYDGNITDKVEVIKNSQFIYYYVKDSSNNEAGIGRILEVQDDEKPTINLVGDNTIYLNVGEQYQELGALAFDNCAGDISKNIEIISNVEPNVAGEYKVIYKVKDASNNETEIFRNVIVSDPRENEGIIYLTFDDGPSAYTMDILNTLDKYGIKATFFVTTSGNDEVLLEEFKRGHTIGLHTATHNWSIYSSKESYYNDLNKVKERVYNLTGLESKYIRFPGGSSNTISKKYAKGIMNYLTTDVLAQGYKYYDWNVSIEDAGACAKAKVTNKPACVLDYFKKGLSRNKVNMVLLHDVKSYTRDALDEMINFALKEGYTFKKIDDDAPMIHQRVNN